jgi:tripartite-type tricarboxylate transporter receptor subunit TctC
MTRSMLLILAVMLIGACVMGPCLTPAAAGTLDYPIKGRTITMIVPSTAGGGTDTAARQLAPLMQKDLGTPVQIVNNFQGGGPEMTALLGGHVDVAFKKRMIEQGYNLRYLPPQEYAAHWDRVDARFKILIELAKQQVQ